MDDAGPAKSPDAGAAKATKDGSTQASHPTQQPTQMPPDMGGVSMDQPSNYDPCTTDDECLARLKASATDLARGWDQGSLVAAECRDDGNSCVRTPVCHCIYAGAHAEGGFTLRSEQDCNYYDRTGRCLIASADFKGCDPGDLCSCLDQCQHAFDMTRQEEARVPDVEARHAQCTNHECRVVLRVDDRCFADFVPRPGGESFDCALSDEQILTTAFADGGRPADCSLGCDRWTECGIGIWSPATWYTECKWSKLCGGGVCGSPVCSAEEDGGEVVCAYEPDE